MNAYIIPGIQHNPVEIIENTVARAFSIKPAEFKKNTRRLVVVKPRQISMYMMVRFTPLTTTKIGMLYDRDHSTVLHAVKVVNDLIFTKDPDYWPKIDSLLAKMETKLLHPPKT